MQKPLFNCLKDAKIMKVLILTNGEYGNYGFCTNLEQYDYIICADHGMCHAKHLGIKPHLIVGDFDSSTVEELAYFEALGVEILRFNPEKDDTDTEIAIQKAAQLGAKEVTIYGGLGSRLDHSLANVHLVYQLLKRGIKGYLINPNNKVSVIDEKCVITGNVGDLVSLIPFSGDVEGVTTKGLAFSLNEATIPMGTSLGVSNYLIEKKAEITIKKGILIIIEAND